MTFRSLICDIKENPENGKPLESYVSLGRVSFWILFGLMMYFWFTEKTVPLTLYNSWWSVLAYNFLKKPLDNMKSSKFFKNIFNPKNDLG